MFIKFSIIAAGIHTAENGWAYDWFHHSDSLIRNDGRDIGHCIEYFIPISQKSTLHKANAL